MPVNIASLPQWASSGGAGYVEDTGTPRLLRGAQVLPIWEGATNVLSIDRRGTRTASSRRNSRGPDRIRVVRKSTVING